MGFEGHRLWSGGMRMVVLICFAYTVVDRSENTPFVSKMKRVSPQS